MSEEIYRQRIERFESERKAHERLSERISWLRVACALAIVPVLVVGRDGRFLSLAAGITLAIALAISFVACVWWHRRARAAAIRAATLAQLNRQAVSRTQRDWKTLRERTAPPACERATLARDLDLFGRASLFQLVSTACTPQGQATLAQWLLEPAEPVVIKERQEAVRELAAMLDWRQELEFLGSKDGGRYEDPAEFLAWAEGPAWLKGRALLSLYGFVAPLLLIVTAVLHGMEWVATPWWGLVLAINLAITAVTVKPIHAIFSRVSSGEQSFGRYAALIEWANHTSFHAPLLSRLQERLRADGRDAADQLHTLQRWVSLSDLRLSTLLYGPLQAATLWDVNVLRGIESWQRRAGSKVRQWLAALAELEALSSLAALAHAEPTWTDATMCEETLLRTEKMGHPLLPSTTRVDNSVDIGPPGTFLLVTGSNMSGKSTLLRSIGVNVVLAQAGGPVCAKSLSLPPLALGASMRVQDSLEEATSYFMAELKRLKQIIDDASRGNRIFLFLLDEILHGTNSHERRIAVRAVLGKLLEQRAIGAVSTHDLDLADAPELAKSGRPVHFRETIVQSPHGRKMTFDYQMRPGLATTTNALVLLELVGLSLDSTKEREASERPNERG